MSWEPLPFLVVGARFVHFAGLAAAIGGALAATAILRAATTEEGPARLGLERAAATVVSRVEIVGTFVALVAGIGLVVANPRVLDPEQSGAGAWLHIKLVLVTAALVLAHVRMFGLLKLVRLGEEEGSNEGERAQLRAAGRRYDLLQLAAYLGILMVVLFRFVWFG